MTSSKLFGFFFFFPGFYYLLLKEIHISTSHIAIGTPSLEFPLVYLNTKQSISSKKTVTCHIQIGEEACSIQRRNELSTTQSVEPSLQELVVFLLLSFYKNLVLIDFQPFNLMFGFGFISVFGWVLADV